MLRGNPERLDFIMALPYLDLQKIVRSALGGGAPDTNIGFGNVVNMAGRDLWNAHQWNHRIRSRSSLNFTAAQAYITLPTDFGTMESLKGSTITRSTLLVTPATFDENVANGILPEGFVYMCCVTQPTQTSATTAMGAPRLELYPTPTASVTAALYMRYRAQWVNLSADASYPNVREFMEPLLCEWIRCWAMGFTEEDKGSTAQRLNDLRQSSIWDAAVNEDGLIQGDYGIIGNGQVQCIGAEPIDMFDNPSYTNP